MQQQENLAQVRNHAAAYRLDPAQFRELLERLGPTFIKLGQFLALRPDLIPQPYCDELLKLVDAVESFPFPVARRIITEDLGAPPEQRFVWINPRPIAAASLAQVHEARTFDGEIVAVKVQRENVHERVKKDLRRARLLSRIFDLSGLTLGVSVPDVLKELARWMRDELDMELELRNITRMYELARDVDMMRVPRPYPELSGRRVLTAEFLEGYPFSELLRLVRVGQPDMIKSFGLDIDNLARNLIHTILWQIFRFKFFHADTHPGNLIAMPNDVVGFVDFGLTETLDATHRPGILRFVSAVYSNDVEGMLHALTEVLT
ncbi:MAG TPA: AarF/ABC1/UbiB kinase family protein, partial [Blastocatellia bacterium]|nr:AarF/ABC1/UbiB kinase family protein [Blastocatellia bacterium]